MDFSYTYDLFNRFHNHPELGFCEYDTSEYLAGELEKYGYKVTRNVGGKTGVIGLFESGVPGKTIVLRADMDALPYEEDGKIVAKHTCGHDSHCAMVMTVARYFSEHPIKKGRLKILFQPAEELLVGSKSVIDSGLIDDADEIIGMHIRPTEEIRFGQIAPGVYHAASAKVEMTIHGVACHAARPHQGVNAIEAAVSIIGAANCIKVDPRVSHSVKCTKFHSGQTFNIVPEKAEICFDMRSQTNEIMRELKDKIKKVAVNIAGAYGATVDIDIAEGVPAAEFDPELLDTVNACTAELFGKEAVQPPIYTGGGEDFHVYTQKLPHCKAAFIGLGADASPGMHHKNMTFNHKAMENGVRLLIKVIEKRIPGGD